MAWRVASAAATPVKGIPTPPAAFSGGGRRGAFPRPGPANCAASYVCTQQRETFAVVKCYRATQVCEWREVFANPSLESKGSTMSHTISQ